MMKVMLWTNGNISGEIEVATMDEAMEFFRIYEAYDRSIFDADYNELKFESANPFI